MGITKQSRGPQIQDGRTLLSDRIERGYFHAFDFGEIGKAWGAAQINRHGTAEISWAIRQVAHHGVDKLLLVAQLQSPVRCHLLTDRSERRRRNLAAAQ